MLGRAALFPYAAILIAPFLANDLSKANQHPGAGGVYTSSARGKHLSGQCDVAVNIKLGWAEALFPILTGREPRYPAR